MDPEKEKQEILERVEKNQRRKELRKMSPSKIKMMKIRYELPSCIFCMEQMEEDFSFLHCGHVFHQSCIEKYKSTKCPKCRKDFTGFPPSKLYFQIKKTKIDDTKRVNFLRTLNNKKIEKIDDLLFEKNEALMDEILKVEDEITEVKRKNEGLNKINTNLDLVHKKIIVKIRELKEDCKTFEKKNERLEIGKKDLENTISAQNKKIRKLEQKAIELKKYKNRFESESDYGIKALIKARDDQKISLQDKCDLFFDQALKFNSKFISLSNTHNQMFGELQKTKEGEGGYKVQIKELRDKVTLRDNEIRDLKEELNRRIQSLKKYKRLAENNSCESNGFSVNQYEKSRMRKVKILKKNKNQENDEKSNLGFNGLLDIGKKKIAGEVDDLHKDFEKKIERKKRRKIGLLKRYNDKGIKSHKDKDRERETRKIKKKNYKKTNEYLFDKSRIKSKKENNKKKNTTTLIDFMKNKRKY